MATTALFIRHRTHPGRRDRVRAVWERRVRAAAARNPGHAAYFCVARPPDVTSLALVWSKGA